MCAVMASRTIDTQSISPDMEYPQASLVLRGRVSSKPHLENTGLGFTSPGKMSLLSYLVVGALLQNSKLHKVNAERKFQLACHLLRLL
jgi:hypothetical protein